MFLSAFVLGSVAFSLLAYNGVTTYSVSSNQLSTSNALVGSFSQDYSVTCHTHAFTDDDELTFYINYQNTNQKLCTLHTLQYPNYYDFDFTFYFQSNLQYQLILAPADIDVDGTQFSMPIYESEYDEPYVMFNYSAESVNYRFKATADEEIYDSFDISYGFYVGFIVHALDEPTFNRLTTSVATAYENGYADGNQQGYDVGYSNGYDTGYSEGQDSSTDRLQSSFDNGYQQGYQQGLTDSAANPYTFGALFGAVADTPILIVRSMFNFDFFGVNVLTVVLSLFTAFILFYLLRKLF